MERPNILYIHTHDSGRYFEPYGYHIPTPNLMAFARESVLFTNAHCSAPTCSPSRAGLLSGMAPHCTGMLGLAHRGFQMNDYSRHMASYFRDNGYESLLCGVQHEAPDSAMIGYSRILAADDLGIRAARDGVVTRREEKTNVPKEVSDRQNARLAANYIEHEAGDKPFFLSFGMSNTHRIYPEHPADIDPDYVLPPFPIANTRENREDMANYIYSARIVDECVGQVLAALGRSGRADNTIVIFTTDHGLAMPHMKCNLTDSGTGVALIFRVPGAPANGQVSDSLVSHLDLYPTLCQLAGIPSPDWLQGYSLVPILQDVQAQVRNELFSEVTYHAAYEPIRAIRTQRYKLIRYYDYHNQYVPANIDNCPSKSDLMRAGFLNLVRPREQLYDLMIDPAEGHNLADNPRYSEVYDTLSRQLNDWMLQTHDPLVGVLDRVPATPDAFVNTLATWDPEGYDCE